MYRTTTRPVNALAPYAHNSRTHSKRQISQVAESIKEFGFTNPVLIDEENGIIAGHGRVAAAELLELSEVPCIIIDGLSDQQKKAYVIADNQLALNAGWDEEILKLKIESLQETDFDINLLGFDEFELKDIMQNTDFMPGNQDDQGQLDSLEPIMKKCPHCGKEFNIREA